MLNFKQITFRKVILAFERRYLYYRWALLYPLMRHLFPVKRNKVCIMSWFGANFNCNPKALAVYMSNQVHDLACRVIVIVNNPRIYQDEYQNIDFIRTLSLKHIYSLATCRVFIANVRMPSFHKRKGQYYIQTWHGTGPKKSEKDSIDSLSKSYVESAILDCKQTDLMISGSAYFSNWIKHSTWYQGKILECGTPRCDVFFHQETFEKSRKKVYSKYGINTEEKLIMYAPTFRSLTEIEDFGFDAKQLIITLTEQFGGRWKLLLRFHPNVARFPIPAIFSKYLEHEVIDVTMYPDMQDLLCSSDILITDFSSVSTEFALQRKPCFLYTPDLNSYDRGLYISPDQMPFPLAKTEGELFNAISGFDEIKYKKLLDKYNLFLGNVEKGCASKDVINEIKKYL